ncbi:MAG: gliding motility-associated C-terminal domain-containing protein [Paludibacteraceae bacterium]|nr:gliding motility-associated C-terminal domain-containing protein [Paludibacteraceae bacterium]
MDFFKIPTVIKIKYGGVVPRNKYNTMYKHLLILSSFIVSSVLSMAQSFSFSDKENGFPYNSNGECLLLTKSKEASIIFFTKDSSVFNVNCYEITFSNVEDSLIIDTTQIATDNYIVSSDSLNVTLKNIKANTGYLITYGDSSCNLDQPCHAFTWVTQYLPIDSITWDKDTVICADLELYISPVMTYKNEYGNEQKIKRSLKLSYNSFLPDDNGGAKIDLIHGNYTGSSSIVLDSFPYVATPFDVEDVTSTTISQKLTTDTFYTQAVVAYPNMKTTTKQQHEGDTGIDTMNIFVSNIKEAVENAKTFRTSGPLSLNFTCNANEMSNHYEWAIERGTNANQGEFRNAFVLFEKDINAYVISDPDLYCIELTVSNIRNDSVCEHKSYGCLRIAESMLNIPNAFTPNGDGTNDEFRVAYRSIESFYISIYDQWGRRVYESEDITKGWDGYVGSKLGTIGTYFYVIKAKGTDGEEYKEKGTINLIRSK